MRNDEGGESAGRVYFGVFGHISLKFNQSAPLAPASRKVCGRC